MASASRPGFQNSEHSGVIVTIYRQSNDPYSVYRGYDDGPLAMDGRANISGNNPSLISLQTQKHMGAAGQFSFVFKAGPDFRTFFTQVRDDDWIDISFTRGGLQWHLMRGLVDECRRDRTVAGSGATSETWTVIGRDFQKIYEQTPIYLSRYAGSADAAVGAYAYQMVNAPNRIGNVAATVDAFLNGWLTSDANAGRANMLMPPGMPNTQSTFQSTVKPLYTGYTDNPARESVGITLMQPEGIVWDLAKEWSDPGFCELFCELYPQANTFVVDNDEASDIFAYDSGVNAPKGCSPNDTQMTVVLRDKPFPVVDTFLSSVLQMPVGMASPWFSLPLFVVPQQAIVASNIGTSGYERLNAFMASPQMIQEYQKISGIQQSGPLWCPKDMLPHGMRPFDVVGRYVPNTGEENPTILIMSPAQRIQAKDWNCLNAVLLNGTITFGRGVPDLRIGCRLRIPGATEDTDETYYIEGVNHSWSLGQGMKTQVTVTRGWVGSDPDYVAALQAAAGPDQYNLASQATPEKQT